MNYPANNAPYSSFVQWEGEEGGNLGVKTRDIFGN